MDRLLIAIFLFFGHNVFSVNLLGNFFLQTAAEVNGWTYGQTCCTGLENNLLIGPNPFKTDNLPSKTPFKNADAGNSLLRNGRWIRVRTNLSGIHRVTFAALKSMGFGSPEKVKVFGVAPGKLPQMNSTPSTDDLTQFRIWATKDKLQNDCFLLYVPGSVTWEYNTVSKSFVHRINQFSVGASYFYLTEDAQTEQIVPIAPSNSQTPSIIVNEFDGFAFFEEEAYNLLETGNLWFSSLITNNTTFRKNFMFPGRLANEPVKITFAAAGRCDIASTLNLSVNNKQLGTQNFVPYLNYTGADYAGLHENSYSGTITGDDLNISLNFISTSNSKCWLDFIRVEARCKLNMSSGQLQFCDTRSVGMGKVADFQLGNAGNGLKIWEVTSPLKPVGAQTETNANILSFKAATDSLRKFIAFDPMADFPGFEKVEEVDNQDLHGLAPPDMLIVTTPDFRGEAERLALFHQQNSGLEVTVVNVGQIYNEFSGGISDVTAIRNFVRLLYHKSVIDNTPKLKYLLLFGKGTYDNVHPVSSENPCYLPTWQSEGSLNTSSSFVSDDYFGLLGDDEGGQKGMVDIGIGRIPSETIAEAKAVVDKTIHYCSTATLGEWRNVVCFVGDDEDNNVHVADSEKLANFVNLNYPAFYTDKIYLDAFKEENIPEQRYPGANKAINDRIKQGALIINYVGHANDEGLAHEKILTIKDIDGWGNFDKMPVFVTATCEFSRWDYKNKQSAGEHVLFNNIGGGIALFSTTRLVYSSSNFEMNKSFFNHVFSTDKDRGYLRMGDIIRLAKNELGGSDNASKFCLLGDPALRLSYPAHIVKTLEINDQPTEQFTDTLKPLSTVSVWGELQDLKGEKLTNYNGTLYPTVFDKPSVVRTLGNGGETPFSYNVQNAVLFKGNVTVKNGEFSFSFKIPKEISYLIGNGLIRYYSNSAEIDANGSFTRLRFGGSPIMTSSDVTGPDTRVFLDDENFVSNDQVSKAPLLIAYVEDESGINTSGSGIGHDITVALDENISQTTNLNGYFQSGQDSYKAGKVLFQLPDLADGSHTLKFKVWDLANNPTEKEISFIVASKLTITDLMAYPNPVREFTDIVADHNRYGEKMKIDIEIFNQLGMLIDRITSETGSYGFVTQPVRWNPGKNRTSLHTGVYHYRVHITAIDGSSATKTGQLLLIP